MVGRGIDQENEGLSASARRAWPAQFPRRDRRARSEARRKPSFDASGMSKYTIERPRHARELQRVDQQPRVPHLPAAVGADEAPKLRLAAASSPGRLPLEDAERAK